ncbi:isopentenyl-diphosphate Delta-isomerase [Maricaulaceae bacterium NA33B04]|nr:isopentenyl-diphosphate Delta-isomerase [Maricaulaceae bacterium NA33B04]
MPVKDASDDARLIAAIDGDGQRFAIDKLEAHRKGLLHDAVSVFVFDGEDMLIQQRAAAKYHCPGLWANACCTHPDWGEDAAASARRRLGEELGIDLALTEVGLTTYKADVGNGLIEHERVRIFRGEADRNTLTFNLHPDEVSAVRWARPKDLITEVASHPDRFAPWLRIYLDRWATLGVAA